jgi:phosphoglycerate kinase
MKILKDIDFKNKRVLLRADYNVPLKDGVIEDDWRIKATLPTIEYILEQPKSKIVIISHLGRPDGKVDLKYSLRPVSKRLGELLEREIIFIEDILNEEGDKKIRNLNDGQVAVAENLRFFPEEESGDEQFAINLAHHFGVYVNDAFSASHRAHASISELPRFKPSCAGFLMEKEIEELAKALNPSKRPSIAVLGGAKIETKLPLIENLADINDIVLLGGRIAYEAQEQKMKLKNNVVLPDDYIDGSLDIGPKTIEKYKMAISAAAQIVWNGAMGKFEDARYENGTKEILGAICGCKGYKIAGGGETVEYINSSGKTDCFSFISSGGGAMLEFLSGKILPGIKALEDNA